MEEIVIIVHYTWQAQPLYLWHQKHYSVAAQNQEFSAEVQTLGQISFRFTKPKAKVLKLTNGMHFLRALTVLRSKRKDI